VDHPDKPGDDDVEVIRKTEPPDANRGFTAKLDIIKGG
jgi:hypothetical protein